MLALRIVLAVLALAFALTGCRPKGTDVRVDGSSTVYPISLAMAEEYAIENPEAAVSVAASGTGGGFEKFCAGETQVNDASRIVTPGEIDACEENGIAFVEIPVAFDALTVVVNEANDWVRCLAVDELNRLWRAEADVTTWSDLRPEWPDEEILLFSPGVDSGTFDSFVETVLDGDEIRTDFFPSEDDNVLVQGVEGELHAIGYFGLAYYLEEEDHLNAVAIDSGDGCVEPSTETVENGRYVPLSRPLFIYVAAGDADRIATLEGWVEFYLSDFAREFIRDSGYPVLPAEAYELSLQRFADREAGSLFIDGAGMTVLEVLGAE